MIQRRHALGLLTGTLAGGLGAPMLAQAQSVNTNPVVKFTTSLGVIDIELYENETPATVANFLNYVGSGAWTRSFFHRLVPGFVLQGGGFALSTANQAGSVPANAAVVNEFSSTRSNLRGTVAMAKLGGNPNSATNQWFVNLANNAANLDNQNGGFTVFGKVSTAGMAVVDKIAALKVYDATNVLGSVYSSLPVIGTVTTLSASNLVLMTNISTDADRVFNYLEKTYPQYVPASGFKSTTGQGYYYRYYAGTNSYVGVKNGQVYYLVPAINNDINLLDSLASLTAAAVAAGF